MFKSSGEKTTRDPQWRKSLDLQKEEATLKKIVDRNYEKKPSVQKKPRPDLIENFNWVIVRFRRMKKVTQEQMAKEISEPVMAIKLAEEGVLPDHDYTLVRKIENYLGIELVKKEAELTLEKEEPKVVKSLTFEPSSAKNLTIADLRKMRERKEPESYSEFEVDFEERKEE